MEQTTRTGRNKKKMQSRAQQLLYSSSAYEKYAFNSSAAAAVALIVSSLYLLFSHVLTHVPTEGKPSSACVALNCWLIKIVVRCNCKSMQSADDNRGNSITSLLGVSFRRISTVCVFWVMRKERNVQIEAQ